MSRGGILAIIGIIALIFLIVMIGISNISDITKTTLIGVIGVISGILIGYIIEGVSQKRAWKREYIVALVKDVYGYLCNEAKWIKWHLENDKPFPRVLNFETWGKHIQEDLDIIWLTRISEIK